MNPSGNKTISFSVLLAFVAVANLAALPILFAHSSTGGTVFGQYSARYAAVLAVAVFLTVLWAALWVFREKVALLNYKISGTWRIVLMLLVIISALGVMFLPFEAHILAFVGVNGVFLIAILAYPLTESFEMSRVWLVGLFLGIAIFVFFVLITNLTQRPLLTDDAHWADASTTVWLKDGLYTRTWREEPIRIVPGVGWVSGLYGWVLLNIDFDLRVGRFVRFASNMLVVLGMSVFMGQLYGRRVAYLTGLFALASFFIIGDGSYRPNMMVTAANFFLMALLLRARESSGKQAYLLHFLVGLGVTLSMELHALAFGLALGASIFYLLDFVWHGRKGEWGYWQMLVAYGVGALLGTLIYYFANIAIVGGLDVYLQKLVGERYVSARSFSWLNPPIIERTLMLASWAYLIWRRSDKDKLFISLFVTVFSATVLIDTAEYTPHVMAFVLLPVALPFIDGLSLDGRLTKRTTAIAGAMLLVMATWVGRVDFDWYSIRYILSHGSLLRPEIYDIGDAIVPYVGHDEVIVTSHEVIWTFYDYPNLTSFAAEGQLQRYHDYDDPSMIWEAIQADVIVDLPRRIETPPGLAAYRQNYFTECHRLHVRAYEIVIYRRDCSDSPVGGGG